MCGLLGNDSSATGSPEISTITPLYRRKIESDRYRSEFSSLLADSYDQIRRSAAGNVAIMMRMLGALHTIAGLTVSPNHRLALREHVQWIAELADRSIESAHDRSLIEQRLTHVRDALEAESVLHKRKEAIVL